jgi:ABC-type taurine transport system ATPase subunit
MLTKLYLKNFKRFAEAEIDLGSPVVFIGPNDSGKTTALQALALWDLGLKRWIEKRGTTIPGKRPGVAINRRDFIAAPIPNANLLWHDLHIRDVRRVGGKPSTSNVLIEVIAEGITNDTAWKCGFEFVCQNEESFYCKPIRTSNDPDAPRMPIPEDIKLIEVAFLPPMSGLSELEFAKQRAEISWLIGQGRTAEVLRNLCHLVKTDPERGGDLKWNQMASQMEQLFGIKIQAPVLAVERAELTMTYVTKSGTTLDISSSGRGVQQTLLLLSYMSVNPNSVILLDEPDAHLEILRQREIYRVLCENADSQHSQIVAASHSEVIMNEAADKDVVVAFVGKPHRIDDRGTQLLKSLKEIGFDQYYQAEQKGWVLYLEGATDLSILLSFARTLKHPASEVLGNPFVHYILNQPQKAKDHFYGLREAKSDLRGFVLCDRLERQPTYGSGLSGSMWKRREIENYLCQPETLEAYAEGLAGAMNLGPLFENQEKDRLVSAMQTTIREVVPPLALTDPTFRYWNDVKASDDFLDVVFERFFAALGHENIMRKTNYHRLAPFVKDIDAEVIEVLDAIEAVSKMPNEVLAE